MVICGMEPILEFGPWVWPAGASGTPPWSLLWLGTFPPIPEAILNGVQNFLVDTLLHLCITMVLPGDLHSWYTSLYAPSISSLVNLGPMNSMAVDSTSRPNSGKGCHWPWWRAQSCSFLPVATACKNIL